MTERSQFWATNNTGDGSSSGYTAENMFEVFRALFTGVNSTNLSGVSPDYLNKLAVAGTSSPVSVATGAALVYGIPYFNSASENVTIPTPASAARIDRIVLRASWSAQTVRITRIAGTEGGAAPSLTQSQGVTWDMPLAQVSITTGGVITITDQREYLRLVNDSGVTTAKIADSAVTTAKIADSAITSAKIADGTIVAGDLASNAVTTAKITDANVTTAKLANQSVDAGKLAQPAVYTVHIADNVITNAKLAQVLAATVKGRITSSAGDVMDLTASQLVDIVKTADGTGTGLDADLLDGSHASAFATAAHTHGTSEIADNAVTNAKLATQAQATIKGRASGAGTGTVTDLTAAQVITILTSADGTGSTLDADLLDGNHATAFAAAVHTHGTSGLDDGAVTNAKMANMAASTVKGRADGSGAPIDLSASQVAAIVNSSNVTAWSNLTLEAAASASSGNTPQYRTVGDEFQLRGAIRISSAVTTLIANLPSSLPGSRTMYVKMAQGSAYLYLSGGNALYIYSGTTGTDYSLEGIRFSTTS